MLSSFSHVRCFVTLWIATCQAPVSLGFSWQEYWSGLPLPPPGDLPNSETESFYVSWLGNWVCYWCYCCCLFVFYHSATWEDHLPFITIQYIHFVHRPTNFPFGNPLCPLYLSIFVYFFCLLFLSLQMNEIIYLVFFLFWLFQLSILCSRSIHVFSNGNISLFYSWVVFHCMYKMHLFNYLPSNEHRFFPYLGYCKQCCNEHRSEYIFLN